MMAYKETTSRRVVAARVKKLRRGMRLTLAEFGGIFGVKALAVWRWENRIRVPQLKHQRTLYQLEVNEANRKLTALHPRPL